jgi:putative flavoprotein involved in K+ transport
VTVTGVFPDGGGWRVRTDRGSVRSRHVVVATGYLDRPAVPELRAAIPSGVVQLHSSRYRHPAQLPDGGVLVVGAGPTGQQIADELAISGRRVHLAVGRHRVLPRRYRGRDAFWWLDRTGASRRTVDELVRRPVRAESSVLAGGRDLDLRVLVSRGVVPHGRLRGVGGPRAVFADDLAASMAAGEEQARRFRERVDRYVARTGLRVAEDVTRPADMPQWACEPSTELELDRGRISAVIWATGYLRDYSWLHAPVLDAAGNPVQRRGVTSAPGLFFLGLSFMWRRDSSFIDGVGADAEHVADHIVGLDARAAA